MAKIIFVTKRWNQRINVKLKVINGFVFVHQVIPAQKVQNFVKLVHMVMYNQMIK